MPPRTTVTLALALLCATAGRASAQTHYSHGKLAKAPAEVPVFTLERTQCQGQCAEYKLSFYSDGTVTYDGKANVSKAGHWRATIPRETVSRIVADFQRLDFFSLENSYAGGLSKNPVAITTLRQNDHVKIVSHDQGSPFSPEALTTLEDRIDGAVQSVDWVR